MNAPLTYRAAFVADPAASFDAVAGAIPWEQRAAPRREAFFSDLGLPYTYGRGLGVRQYHPVAWPAAVRTLKEAVEAVCGVPFEACFANYYAGPHDHLGWHADDSPSIDAARPIAIVSLGSERSLWVRPFGGGAPETVERFVLAPGSLAIMGPGMQQTHQHRIPKHPEACGPRLSLTFRGLHAA